MRQPSSEARSLHAKALVCSAAFVEEAGLERRPDGKLLDVELREVGADGDGGWRRSLKRFQGSCRVVFKRRIELHCVECRQVENSEYGSGKDDRATQQEC
jgi:hypothetical protein